MAALPDEIRARVEAHLAGCSLCRLLQRDFAAQAPEMTREEAERVRERIFGQIGKRTKAARGNHFAWTWIWRPALVMAALVLVATYVARQPGTTVPPPTAPGVPQPPGLAASATLFRLEKPSVKLPASILLLRGEADSERQFLEDIAPALDAFRAENYAEAHRRFEPISRKYPQSAELFFYWGVSQLFLERNAEAVRVLETSKRLSKGEFLEDVDWYLALAHYRAGDASGALAELKPLCARKGARAEKACVAARELEQARPSEPRE